MLPMRPDEFCPRQRQVADLGALGFSFKKVFKKATTAVKKAVSGPTGVVRAVVAPIAIGVTAPLRAATWVADKAGIPGAGQASEYLRKELDKQAAIVGAEAAIGAVVGGAILAAPAVASAASAAGATLSTGTIGTAATAFGKDAAMSIVKGAMNGKPAAPTDTPVTEVNSTPYGPELPPGYTDPRMLKAGILDGGNLYITVGGAMALGLIAYALYGTKKPAAAAVPGPLSSLHRTRRRRAARRSRHARR
jgi:hypothetical protein